MVESDALRAVFVAEDVSAVVTVVAAREAPEFLLAGREVADLGEGVGRRASSASGRRPCHPWDPKLGL